MDLLTVLCLITIIFFLILIHYRFHSIFRSKHRHASNDYVLELHSSTKCQCKYCQGTYKPIKRLGYGGYGISYLCKNIYTDVLFVLKSIPVQSINDANEALNEVYFLQRLHHPNIVHYEEVFESFLSSFSVLFALRPSQTSERSLQGHYYHGVLRERRFIFPYHLHFSFMPLYSRSAVSLHCSTVSCLSLHSQIWYCSSVFPSLMRPSPDRDIKPDNIFITQKESIRLGDFGLARVINPSMLKHIQTYLLKHHSFPF